ncbi:LADA_0H13454g1_1 [Lachancea dasiensis]|uniref:LADA_0H13454g1_1 n=1 Tax=Lachancea dasiensis TaxID=1072105 RepID=A0A1G4K430_9SACH|nr:LADA_0H13454g1_1 [Lachancea dasiensis]
MPGSSCLLFSLRQTHLFRPKSRMRCLRLYGNIDKRSHRQQLKDEAKLKVVRENLGFDLHGIAYGEVRELAKCLYPKDDCMVRLPDGKAHRLGHLQVLGNSSLQLNLNRTFLDVFRKSKQDIGGLDFNYEAKMSHLSSAKRSPDKLLQRFIRHRYDRLARIPMPESAVPIRIQRVFDRRSFHALIGYISLINDQKKVAALLHDEVSRPVVKELFGH